MATGEEERSVKTPDNANRRGDTRVRELEFLPNDMDVLYPKELKSFFKDFEDHYGTTPSELLEEIEGIWRKDGLVHPKELMKQLLSNRLEKQTDVADVEKNQLLHQLLNEVVDAGYMVEPLTNSYDSKQAVPLMTGLAHLYAQTVAKEEGHKTPVTIIEGDFGNMGGTNHHFAALLGHPEDSTYGWNGTDSAARIAANIALIQLQDFVKESGGTVLAARNGGDELRLIVTGVPTEEVNAFLRDVVHPSIDEFTAMAGLHDHAHTKEKEGIDPKYREGFSLSFGAADLRQEHITGHEIVLQAEEMINVNKLRSGYIRKGEVTQEELNQQKDKVQDNEDLSENIRYVDRGAVVKAFIDAQQDMLKDEAANQGRSYKALKKQTKLEVSEVSDDVLNESIKSEEIKAFEAAKKRYSAYHPDAPLQDHLFTNQKDDPSRAPFQTEYAGLEKIITDTLALHDVILTEAQQKIFAHVAAGYPAIDPVTLTLMERDLPRHAAMYAGDAAKIGEAPSRALHIECTNLAGYNEISHAHANLILREEAVMLEDTLKAHGLDEKAVYHLGGGKFVVLVPSVDVDNKNAPIEQSTIDAFNAELAQKIRDFNDVQLAGFFEQKGFDTPDLLKDKKIGEVENPKRAHETGMDVLCVQRELTTQQRGGAQIYELRQEAERQMQEKRNSEMPIQEVEQPKTWAEKMGKGSEREKIPHSFADMVKAQKIETHTRAKGFNHCQ